MTTEQNTPDPLLTPDDVARLLGVSINTLNAWRVQRINLDFVKVGKLARYRASEVERFIESQTRKAATA